MQSSCIIEQNRTEQNRTEQLIVSFCIPVYNNAEAAEKIVNGILCSDNTRFEVIVSDDASSDNAEERLSRIHDSRFRYYRNEKNLGAHKNWEHALELGHGEYLYLVMGRDRIKGEHINRLIEILEYAQENNITLLEDGYSKKDDIQIYSGINAMIHFLGAKHPTGTIFNRKLFHKIPHRTRYFEILDMYPENYVRLDMLLKGKGASVMSGVYDHPDFLIDKIKIKSAVENGKNLYDMFYAPGRRTGLFFELIDMTELEFRQRFNEDEKNRYFDVKFRELLMSVSFDWRGYCRNYEWQMHYGQQIKNVSTTEMIHNILTAYRDTVIHLKDKGTYTYSKRCIMNQITPIIIVKVIVKNTAKLILEPVGIWKVLKYIKRCTKG